MKYIIGLGNPGLEYKTTKHNVGFNVVRAVAEEGDITLDQKLYSAVLGKGRILGEEVTLVLPQTYMNLAGETVKDLMDRQIRSIDDIIVVCDDINLKLGRIRLRKKGSAGGHKGLESIINMLERNDFSRLRVGIATEIHKGDIANYVLSPFKRKDHKHVEHVLALARDAVLYWVKNGTEKAMTKFNNLKIGTS